MKMNLLFFKDIYPKSKIHILLFPKRIFTNIRLFKNSSNPEKEQIFLAFENLIKFYKIEKSRL